MTTTDPAFEFLLGVLEDRGLAVVVTPAGEPRLRGPAAEVTPALKEMLKEWRAQLVERFRPPPAAAPREWLWRYGHTYTETPDDAWLWGHADRHPAGAWWWRVPGGPWVPVAGRCDETPESFGLGVTP